MSAAPQDPRIHRVARSPLFDQRVYADEVGSDFATRLEAAQHYVESGARNGVRPSLYFDPAFYANQAGAGPDGLVSYLTGAYDARPEPHPLFDSGHYMNQAGLDALDDLRPLEHYAAHGQDGPFDPCPFFDARRYSEACPGASVPGMTALLHYLQTPAFLKVSPLEGFDPRDYLRANPDVQAAGMDALVHYVSHGRAEGRPLRPPAARGKEAGGRKAGPLASLSIVLPTYNRATLLAQTLDLCAAASGGLDIEFVVIDDGSTDATPQVLAEFASRTPSVVWRSVPNGGPGRARNIGADLATKEVILFLGDDIQPLSPDFFYTHARLHALSPSDRFAVLGKCVWPEQAWQAVNFVMAHIQGHGGEQFGYADLDPFTFIDWRFFYTANVSVKKSLVKDWLVEGFRAEFTLAAFEDNELAYRLSQKPGGFTIFYDPSSVGRHIHPYTVDGFMSRQMSAGLMAKVFLDMHPLHEKLGLDVISEAFLQPREPGDDAEASDYMAMMEGVKSWARILERSGVLGREAWHEDILFGVFEMSYLHGFVLAQTAQDTNFVAAYRHIMRTLTRRLNRVIHHEVSAHEFVRRGLMLST